MNLTTYQNFKNLFGQGNRTCSYQIVVEHNWIWTRLRKKDEERGEREEDGENRKNLEGKKKVIGFSISNSKLLQCINPFI